MNIQKINQWSLKTKLRLIFGFVLFLVLTLFISFKIVPSGEITYTFSQKKANNFFSAPGAFRDFRPGLRIDNKDKEALKIISEPLYFKVFSPRHFNSARVTLKYEDSLSEESPIIELGLLKGEENANYELKPLENKIIDSLSTTWHKIESEKDMAIFQQQDVYSNEADFWQDFNDDKLKNCPQGVFDCTAFYNHHLIRDYSLPPSRVIKDIEINQALRGAHQFFVYFRPGDWYLDLVFRQLALKDGLEKIEVKIFSGQELISEKSLMTEDVDTSAESFNNNIRQGSIIASLEFEASVKKDSLYRVEIMASDDVVIEQIRSSSDQIVFINSLWPVYEKNVESFFSKVNNITLKTFETESLGEINFNGERARLDRTYYNLSLESKDKSKGLKNLRLENTGVLIELNGLISLNKDSYFQPRAKKLDRFFSPETDASYVIANYKPPKQKDLDKVAVADFDLRGVNSDNGFYSFVLSIPGLNLDPRTQEAEANNNYLRVKEIKLDLKGKSLVDKIIEKFFSFKK